MNADKLLKLADYLENLDSSKKFTLNIFGKRKKSVAVKNPMKLSKCGTAGCALGYATDIFTELKMIRGDIFFGYDYLYVKNMETNSIGFEAAVDFFGISLENSFWLFDPLKYEKGYRTRKHVAKRIREFVEKRKTYV